MSNSIKISITPYFNGLDSNKEPVSICEETDYGMLSGPDGTELIVLRLPSSSHQLGVDVSFTKAELLKALEFFRE